MKNLTSSQKKNIIRILIALVIYIGVIIVTDDSWNRWLKLALFAVPYLIAGADIIYDAFRNILRLQFLDENFLMCIATFGAFAIEENMEAVAVMIFFQIGEFFQDYAVNKSRQSIKELMDICPEYANVETGGTVKKVDPDSVEVGDIILIKPGEKVPLDGIISEGSSYVDTSPLTGESVPVKLSENDEIISGCINKDGVLRVKVTKEFEDSTVAKILELVEDAASKKARAENFITRFAKYYTPIVVVFAALLAIVPPVFFGQLWSEWLSRACIFLVISCPCALVISIPLGFFGGIGAASKHGILIKGGNYIEELAKMDTIVFDKTGTLTRGEFKVNEIVPASGKEEDKESLLRTAARAEKFSNHPVSKSVCAAWEEYLSAKELNSKQDDNNSKIEEYAGMGVKYCGNSDIILVGNKKLMDEFSISFAEISSSGTVLYVAHAPEKESKKFIYLGYIVISDSLKEDTRPALEQLKAMGIKQMIMLTGDSRQAAEAVAEGLAIDRVYSKLLPGDKVDKMEEILEASSQKGVAFVGDGINDAPVLSRANIGIAMGSMGSDAAIEAADVVLMDDMLSKVPKAVGLARFTLRIVKENIVFALGVKLLVLLLGALGLANMWEAVFADVGVCVIAIINSMRTLKK